jgi:uncharacterized lipoprotein NlpE involved in copper resistance
MSSEKQKQAARKNIKKAQAARRGRGGSAASGISTAEKDRLKDSQFDAERDEAWKRILRAADRFGVEVEARSWRELTSN